MVLEAFRTRVASYVAWLARPFLGWRPDRLSWLALGCAGVGGLLAALVRWTTPLLFLPVAIVIFLSGLFDVLDGEVARATGRASVRGDFLDHVLDRYADIFIITGIFAGGLVPWQIGVFALTGVLMASYLGTQAQAVGVGRYYGGLLGRADRLVMIMAVGIIDLLVPLSFSGLSLLGWMLILFGLFGHITAFQRFAYVWAKVE